MERDDVANGDKLILRGLMFHGFHGVKSEEKTLGQKFLIDIDAWMDLSKAGKTDCLDDTVSYTDLYSALQHDYSNGAIHMKKQTSMVPNAGNLCDKDEINTFSQLCKKPPIWIARDVVEGTPQNLLESVAHLIASNTLTKFPKISAVRVKVGKPHVAVHGPLDYLGIEIYRNRKS